VIGQWHICGWGSKTANGGTRLGSRGWADARGFFFLDCKQTAPVACPVIRLPILYHDGFLFCFIRNKQTGWGATKVPLQSPLAPAIYRQISPALRNRTILRVGGEYPVTYEIRGTMVHVCTSREALWRVA